MTNDVQAALALLRAHVGDLHQVGTVRTEALATRLDDALDVLDDQTRKREVEVLLDECIRLRAQLATATTQLEQGIADGQRMSGLRLQDAGALHLADESTIYQLERQVQTLTAMWTTLHSALGLPADQGVSADLVVGRLRAAEARVGALEETPLTLAQAMFWLLRAYESGHRQGWEPGPSTKETMDGLHTWLCGEGFDPNGKDTPHYVPQILAALLTPPTPSADAAPKES